MTDEPIIAREALPTGPSGSSDPMTWPSYRKVGVTRAIRHASPFIVETSEGQVRCENGYIAIDSRGYPYPIAYDEFQLAYRPLEENSF